MAIKGFHVRIDGEMLDKLYYIANYNGRTATGQVIYMVRQLIEGFEEKHGEIHFGAGAKLKKERLTF